MLACYSTFLPSSLAERHQTTNNKFQEPIAKTGSAGHGFQTPISHAPAQDLARASAVLVDTRRVVSLGCVWAKEAWMVQIARRYAAACKAFKGPVVLHTRGQTAEQVVGAWQPLSGQA